MNANVFAGQLDELRRLAARHPTYAELCASIREVISGDTAQVGAAPWLLAQLEEILRAATESDRALQLARLSTQIEAGETVLSIARELRDGAIADLRSQGLSLRDIAPIAQMSPEMVRRVSDSRTVAIRQLAHHLGTSIPDALRAAVAASVAPQDWKMPVSQDVEDRLRVALNLVQT